MEFSLFAHMEKLAPHQPDDALRTAFLSLCKMADEGGMRAIWTGEHHGMAFTIAPNPFLSIVDLAHQTTNVRLGTGTVIAPFWHPIKLAGEAASTDVMTGGRLELGIARGAYAYEYERLMPGMDAWEAARDIELGHYSDWSDPERIAVNVDSLYREFDADAQATDVMELFRRMAELAGFSAGDRA